MKFGGYLVVLGLVLGVVAFFLPIIGIHEGRRMVSATGYQLACGQGQRVALALFVHVPFIAFINAVAWRFTRIASALSSVIWMMAGAIVIVMLDTVGARGGSGAFLLAASCGVGFIGSLMGVIRPSRPQARAVDVITAVEV